MIRIRTAAAVAGATLLAAAAVALALSDRGIVDGTGITTYTPSYVVTTAETPPRWAVLDNGVQWAGEGDEPFVVCVLNTTNGRITRKVPVPTSTWRTSPPMAWSPGVNCPG